MRSRMPRAQKSSLAIHALLILSYCCQQPRSASLSLRQRHIQLAEHLHWVGGDNGQPWQKSDHDLRLLAEMIGLRAFEIGTEFPMSPFLEDEINLYDNANG